MFFYALKIGRGELQWEILCKKIFLKYGQENLLINLEKICYAEKGTKSHVNHAMLLSDLSGPRKYVGWILYTHFLLVEGDHYYICNGIDGCCNCLVNHTCVKANIKVCTLGIHKR